MKAMIFAAGLGIRLKPLTDNTPKALVRINDTPLLELLIHRLISYDINHVLINVHHFAHQIIEFVDSKNSFGIDIQFSDERGSLLDTGGGLKKARWFFDKKESFLVHNVDVISDIDLHKLLDFHNNSGALATLAVRNRESLRYLLFNSAGELSGWEHVKTGEQIITRWNKDLVRGAFSGIQVINPKIFDLIEETGKFSIIKTYLGLSEKYKICPYWHNDGFWLDVGTIDKVREAEKGVPFND